MSNVLKVTVLTAAIGAAVLSPTASAHAGGSDVGAGLLGFGVGAIVGSVLAPQVVYVAPPPPPVYYYPPPPPVYYGTVVYAPRYRRGYYRHRHR
jgi:hypothetical protein